MAPHNDPKGQGLVEYALIIMLVAAIVIVVMWLLGPAIGSTYSNIINNIANLP